MRDIIVTLCKECIGSDEIGQSVTYCEKKNEVFALMGSIRQSEFYSAAQTGLNPEFKIEISEFDYSGENLVCVEGNLYKIYRTFTREDERIELYCTCATGIEMR